MPQVELLGHELEELGSEPNLWREGSNRLKHGTSEGGCGLEELLESLAVLDCVQEHLVDTLCKVLLFLSREDCPELPEELGEQDVGQGLVVVVCRIDADDF